jgi:hypothetical protein
MIGTVPITVVLALAAAAVLLVVLVFGSRSRATRPVAQSFWCSRQAQNVTAEFEEKTWDGKRVDVASCTAFSPPTDIRCVKQCLVLKRLPAAVVGPEVVRRHAG